MQIQDRFFNIADHLGNDFLFTLLKLLLNLA